MKQILFVFIAILLLSLSCKQTATPENISQKVDDTMGVKNKADSLLKIEKERSRDSILLGHDSSWVDLSLLIPNAKFDIRYADTNNFMKIKVYDCPACYMRLIVAKSLINAAKSLDSMGLAFVFYDCYRPSSAQWKLWEKMPNASYVMPPVYGSNHSRGTAIDLGLFDLKTKEILDMGSDFDHFGVESWLSYQGHTAIVKKNRQCLIKIMSANNFNINNNEWWHFDYKLKQFNLSDFKWDCSQNN
jgi:D-alanyl-D-alanine dipeptidase